MKFLHILLGVVLTVAVAAAGAAAIWLGGWGVPSWAHGWPWRQWLLDWRGVAGGSLWLAAWAVFIASGWLARRRRRQVITFENDDGRVTVDTEAVRSYLTHLKDEFAAANWVKPAVTVERGALRIVLDLGVRAGTQIPELCRLMQARVKEILQEHLGTCDLLGVEMNVHEIGARKGGGTSSPLPPENP